MNPNSFSFDGIHWWAVLAAVVANFILGFIWYAPWFPTGKVWMRHMGYAADHKPAPGEMAKGMVLMLVGAFLLMFVLAHTFWAYQDAYTNTAAGGEAGRRLSLMDGLTGGFFVWLGFFLPVQLSGLAWERKSGSLVAVNAGYYLVTLLIAGVLMVHL